MIRAVTFDKQLLKSEDFAHQVNYFYQGKMGVSKGCEITTDTNRNLVVSDGYFSIYGRLLKNVGDTLIPVPSITSGSLYSILVFEIDLSKENTIDIFNQGSFKIISNTTAYPTLTQENLDNGGNIYQLEFCRFINTVSGVTSLTDTRSMLSLEMYALKSTVNEQLDTIKIDTDRSKKMKTMLISRNTNINGLQVIEVGFRPKFIRILAVISGTNCAYYNSDGSYDGTNQVCISKYGENSIAPLYSPRMVTLHSGNAYNYASLSHISDTGFALDWTGTGTLPGGVVINMKVEVF